jgi:hypothetical protein
MQQATGTAGTVVLKLMTDPNGPAAVRLRAAECLFDRAIKGIELEDIEARVSELERATEANGRGRRTLADTPRQEAGSKLMNSIHRRTHELKLGERRSRKPDDNANIVSDPLLRFVRT